MKTEEMAIIENREVAKDTYLLILDGFLEAQPGQYCSLSIPGFFLRRPLGIVANDGKRLSFLYKVVGEGTLALSRMKKGEKLDVFGPLGHGFEDRKNDSLLVSAGLGIAPILFLARTMKQEGKIFHLVCCFNSKSDIPLMEELKSLDPSITIVTLDGSVGIKGIFKDGLKDGESRKMCYCCGPLPFMKACEEHFSDGYLSLECRMGCGYGICNGCTILSKDGKRKKICKDGPVFAFKEVEY